MNDKQIYELKLKDLLQVPVWYFPMDETVEDELTVRPFTESDANYTNHQLIVRTTFADVNGNQYKGYLYWGEPETVEQLKPVVYVNEDKCITCWNGIRKPSWSDYENEQTVLRDKFPLSFASEIHAGLHSLSGKLEGLYFIDDFGNVTVIK